MSAETKRKLVRLPRALIVQILKESGQALSSSRGSRRRMKIVKMRSLGEIATEATASRNDKIVTLEVSIGTEPAERRTFRIRFSPAGDDYLYQTRPELALADTMGAMNAMENVYRRMRDDKHPGAAGVPRTYGVGIRRRNRKRLFILPPRVEWEGLVSCQAFTEGTDLLSGLMARKNETSVNEDDVTTMTALAELLKAIHVKEDITDSAREFLFEESKRYMLGRVGGWHNLSHGKHSLLTSDEGCALHQLISSTIHECGGASERLRVVWGDAHFGNVLRGSDGSLAPNDPRVRSAYPQRGDPGVDVGFLVTDLWWFYRVFGNPAFKARAQVLLEAYENLTGDKEIRTMAARTGVPYRTAMRLKGPYGKAEEILRARPFVDDTRKWMVGRCIDVSL